MKIWDSVYRFLVLYLLYLIKQRYRKLTRAVSVLCPSVYFFNTTESTNLSAIRYEQSFKLLLNIIRELFFTIVFLSYSKFLVFHSFSESPRGKLEMTFDENFPFFFFFNVATLISGRS